MPRSPLGRGILTGTYRRGLPGESPAGSDGRTLPRGRDLTEESSQIVDAVAIAAQGMSVSPAQIALAWVRDRPGVVAPIVGVRTTAQLRAALGSENLELPAEIIQALNDVSD
jgi:aryl-alcohol dehydrogenase-like predicted oxidoreductase